MKEKILVGVITFIIVVIIVVLSLIFRKWFFETIYYADIPTWIKYFFLK